MLQQLKQSLEYGGGGGGTPKPPQHAHPPVARTGHSVVDVEHSNGVDLDSDTDSASQPTSPRAGRRDPFAGATCAVAKSPPASQQEAVEAKCKETADAVAESSTPPAVHSVRRRYATSTTRAPAPSRIKYASPGQTLPSPANRGRAVAAVLGTAAASGASASKLKTQAPPSRIPSFRGRSTEPARRSIVQQRVAAINARASAEPNRRWSSAASTARSRSRRATNSKPAAASRHRSVDTSLSAEPPSVQRPKSVGAPAAAEKSKFTFLRKGGGGGGAGVGAPRTSGRSASPPPPKLVTGRPSVASIAQSFARRTSSGGGRPSSIWAPSAGPSSRRTAVTRTRVSLGATG